PHARDVGEVVVARRHRIDAEIGLRVANQIAVEVVPVRFGKPRPGKNIGDDFVQRELLSMIADCTGVRASTGPVPSASSGQALSEVEGLNTNGSVTSNRRAP